MGPLSRWAVNRPVIALISWVVALVVAGGLAGIFGGAFNDSFELPDTESTQAQELLEQTAGAAEAGGGTIRIVWSPENGSVTDPAVVKEITPLLEEVADLDSISCVQSPYGEQYGSDCQQQETMSEEELAKLPPEQQQQIQESVKAAQEATSPISPDGKVAYATATIEGGLEGLSIPDAQSIVSDVKGLNGTDGLTVGASGSALGFAAQEPPSSELIGIVVAIVILLIVFGSIIAAGLPILTAIVGLIGGMMLVTFVAGFLDVATFAPTLAAMIGLGVGIDYSLFVLNRYRQGIMAGHDPKKAAMESVNTSGRAVAFAGVTVIIALMGLWVLGINFFYGLSLAAAVTVFMVMLSAVWMLPALLSLLGNKALGWRLPWGKTTKTWHPEGGAWAHYGRMLQKAPVIPFLVALAVVLIIAAPVLGIRLGFTDDGGRADGDPLRIGYDLQAEGFGPGVNGPFFIAVDLDQAGDTAAVGAIVKAIDDTEGVASTLPNEQMIPLVVEPDTKVVPIQVIPTTSPQDEATTDLLNTLRDDTLPPVDEAVGAQSYVGGFQAVTADFTTVLTDSLPLFLSVVIGLGFLALMVLFRSLVVPLTAAITSLLSLAAAMGITVAVFQNGWGASLIGVESTGPIMPFLPIMVFAILFGLSMDYQVFLVSRMSEEWAHTKDNKTAVRRGLAGSGRVVAIAALIMFSVFVAFVPTPDSSIKLFGIALSSAVLIDAFIVRLVMVPSLMSFLGNANWWVPGWLGKILPTINVEGSDEITDDVEEEPVAP